MRGLCSSSHALTGAKPCPKALGMKTLTSFGILGIIFAVSGVAHAAPSFAPSADTACDGGKKKKKGEEPAPAPAPAPEPPTTTFAPGA